MGECVRLIFAGESRGGVNANNAFFDALERDWECERVVDVEPFPGAPCLFGTWCPACFCPMRLWSFPNAPLAVVLAAEGYERLWVLRRKQKGSWGWGKR
jgi:hypothetical protein